MSARHRFGASAPVRVDLAGGWTDVAPFAVEHGGAVVNAAIELRARVEVEPGEGDLVLDARDLGRTARISNGNWTADQRASFTLQQAALKRAGLIAGIVRTSCEVPPGSGLGSSGALGVALISALDAMHGRRRAPEDVAEAAFELEAVEAGLAGGRQDQYAAALGGCHLFRFSAAGVQVEALTPPPEFLATLERQLVVCFTGSSRVSSATISRVMHGYVNRDGRIDAALHRMVELAERMAGAFRAGDLAAMGELLSANWNCQQQLDSAMRTSDMARLEAAMRIAGVLGAKAAGAGAGGSMVFLVRDPEAAARAAAETGARVLPFRWARQGVTTW